MAVEMIKISEDRKFAIFSDSLSSLTAVKGKKKIPNHSYIHEILETCHYLIKSRKLIILACFCSHVSIKGNQKADALAKEATKMTLRKIRQITKMISYMKRKWQTIWEISKQQAV